jgi:hypothetical protein
MTKDVSEATVERGESLPSNWDTRDWPAIASRTIGAARDRDYLTWRYLEHPCFNYRLQTVAEGDRTGLAVWRLENIRVATAVGPVEVDRIGRLVEFLPVSRNNARDLLLDIWQDLSAADALGADYYGYHKETGAWLQELGFLQTDRHPDGETIPSRFQPLDLKGGAILTAAFLAPEAPRWPTRYDDLWYWTKSDGDQDRPN